jgi:membrane protein DedA with SNARE-associated domain
LALPAWPSPRRSCRCRPRTPCFCSSAWRGRLTWRRSPCCCLFWFALGGRLGPARADALILRFGRYIFLRHETYLRFAGAYRRNHMRASLVAQFVPTVRNYLPIAAGALRLPALPFAFATLLGAMLWNAGFLIAGYAMRGSVHDLPTVAFRIMAFVLVIEIAFFIALRWRWRSRLRQVGH